ncbi:hypothetical protein CEXT_135991 [Caerostris extrusa]|uniref:Uncharacterized protein n=1 Tax=Caerostris extrusa TaxID=172846 RepID=A0AAV4XLS8_CAEEX|nr:hypothetical protein CEXT_135991 [Caerostris extrusa]
MSLSLFHEQETQGMSAVFQENCWGKCPHLHVWEETRGNFQKDKGVFLARSFQLERAVDDWNFRVVMYHELCSRWGGCCCLSGKLLRLKQTASMSKGDFRSGAFSACPVGASLDYMLGGLKISCVSLWHQTITRHREGLIIVELNDKSIVRRPSDLPITKGQKPSSSIPALSAMPPRGHDFKAFPNEDDPLPLTRFA